MPIPQVVIIGRPNVGKSSILNWLARQRLAIVDDVAGVTRDRLTCLIEHDGATFELVDTGGIGVNDVDDLTTEIEQQIHVGIESSDLLIFVVDSLTGTLPLDQEVVRRLRRVKKPILFVANKADRPTRDADSEEFYRLGQGAPLLVSTKADRNRTALLDSIVAHLPNSADSTTDRGEPEMKVAIVGRRNVGKSTFVNTLSQTDRMIVSEVPGTTRDSVDVRFELDGKSFVAIDTPGLRRTGSIKTDVDFYGSRRTKRSIRRADVVLLFWDAEEPVSKVDKQLCHFIAEQFKPCIFVVNKWDLLAERVVTEEWAKYLHDTFPSMWHVPVAFITGKTGKNVKKLLNHAQMLYKQSRQRVPTAQLNSLVSDALAHHPPPLLHHHRPKIYYATQISTQPPTMVLMCNNPKAFPSSYRRYLLGVFRDQLSFGEVPIRLVWQTRGRDDQRDTIGTPAARKFVRQSKA